MSFDGTYNGYKNRQTWNVALYIGNDYHLYVAAKEYVKRVGKRHATYDGLLLSLGFGPRDWTPDGVWWVDKRISRLEMRHFLQDL